MTCPVPVHTFVRWIHFPEKIPYFLIAQNIFIENFQKSTIKQKLLSGNIRLGQHSDSIQSLNVIFESLVSYNSNLLDVLLVLQVLLGQVDLDHPVVQPYRVHLLLLLVRVVLVHHLHHVYPVLQPYHLDRFDPWHLVVLELLEIPYKNVLS